MKTADLQITCIQAPLIWEDKHSNLRVFEQLIRQTKSPCDLFLLPEVFNSGFSMNPEKLSEPMDGMTVEWMQGIASDTGSVIAGTIMVEEAGRHLNRLLWVTPEGIAGFYDKRHLFSMGQEGQHFDHGQMKAVFHLKGWNVMPLVCYDLRFPVWSMNTFAEGRYGYDLLIYLANWPRPRRHHWHQLLTARAIENQAFVAGVNRTGIDGNNIDHAGHTKIIDPYGLTLAEAGEEEVKVLTTTLSRSSLEEYRERFPVGADWHLSL